MKLKITFLALLLLPFSGNSQNYELCDALHFDTEGQIAVKINTIDGCFKVFFQGRSYTDNTFTSSLTFKSAKGVYPIRIVMKDGFTIESKLELHPLYKHQVYDIVKKKNKYKLQINLSASKMGFELNLNKKTQAVELDDSLQCEDRFVNYDLKKFGEFTVIRITKDHVFYVDCSNANEEQKISKTSILAIEYANGTFDKFDYTSDNKKKGLNLTRSREEIKERHIKEAKAGQETSPIIVGPTQRR